MMVRKLTPKSGAWTRIRELLRTSAPLSARAIADKLDIERQEVGSLLASMARRNKVVRVLTPEPGPLLWKLPEAPR